MTEFIDKSRESLACMITIKNGLKTEATPEVTLAHEMVDLAIENEKRWINSLKNARNGGITFGNFALRDRPE